MLGRIAFLDRTSPLDSSLPVIIETQFHQRFRVTGAGDAQTGFGGGYGEGGPPLTAKASTVNQAAGWLTRRMVCVPGGRPCWLKPLI